MRPVWWKPKGLTDEGRRHIHLIRFAFAQPEASISMNVSYVDGVYTVEVTNNSQYISYMNILKAKNAEGELVVPAYWSDNFFALTPGQTKTVTCCAGVKGVKVSSFAKIIY